VFGVVSSAGYVVTTTHPTPSSSLSLNDMVNGGEPPGQTLTTAVTIPTSGVGLIFAAGSKAATVAPVCTWTGGVTIDAVLVSFVGTGNGSSGCAGRSSAAGSVAPTVSAAASGFMNFNGGDGIVDGHVGSMTLMAANSAAMNTNQHAYWGSNAGARHWNFKPALI
jgi:hypothetical protein